MKHFLSFFFSVFLISTVQNTPAVITTWNFKNSAIKAWDILQNGGTHLDALEQGLTVCEIEQCDFTVGYGGSPDENGETTLDALFMDGKTINVGAVGALRRIKNAASVARHVMEHSKHSFLVGELATEFAVQMGFQEESLTGEHSKAMWKKWRNEDNCQPNYWMNVKPDPTKFCGPYSKSDMITQNVGRSIEVSRHNHDTIGMVTIDINGNIAAGTSSNGAKFKIPGRVGDSPIPGAGAYVDNAVGGAAATGDGDVMLRFLPSFLAVEKMRQGASPRDAARVAVQRIADHYPDFMGAVVTVAKNGEYGAACHGLPSFPYVVPKNNTEVQIAHVLCI